MDGLQRRRRTLACWQACITSVDVRGARSWVLPFVVAGRNPILLYTLAVHSSLVDREVWRRALGRALFAGYWGPVLESVACGLSLWLVACAAYRLKVFVRIWSRRPPRRARCDRRGRAGQVPKPMPA